MFIILMLGHLKIWICNNDTGMTGKLLNRFLHHSLNMHHHVIDAHQLWPFSVYHFSI